MFWRLGCVGQQSSVWKPGFLQVCHGIWLVTSLPDQNTLAEKTVHIAKRIFDKSKAYGKDPNLSFLEYRTIGYSPAQLLMSHKLRSTLLVILDELKPKRPVRVKEMIGSRKKVLWSQCQVPTPPFSRRQHTFQEGKTMRNRHQRRRRQIIHIKEHR